MDNENLHDESDGQWASLLNADLSLLQGSNLESQSVSQLQGHNLGWGDLSCSLLHCGGADENKKTNDVDNLVQELNKRDHLITSLVSSLTTVLKQREDGDSLLISIENQLIELTKNQLDNLDVLKNSLSRSRTVADSNSVANINLFHSTLLDDLEIEKENLPDSPLKNSTTSKNVLLQLNQYDHRNLEIKDATITTSYRNVGTSVSPTNCNIADQKSQNTQTERRNSEIMVTNNILQTEAETQTVDEQKSNKNGDADDPDIYGSPQQVVYPPINPDSLRLTFSPSICEYEAEANFGDYSTGSAAVDDLKLQICDAERKLESTRKYLEEMTTEREQEREEFQRTINDLTQKYEESKRDKEKADNVIEQQKFEILELEDMLHKNEQIQSELINKFQNTDFDLKQAIEKIFELRDIIRGLEEQVETTTREATLLSEYKKLHLNESVLENFTSKFENCPTETKDDCGGSVLEHTEELQTKVHELAKKIEDKLQELENFPWHARPGSSCSVKSDDISVRASVYGGELDDSVAARDFVSQIFTGLRRLEYSFDSLVRFEDVLLKKLKDSDLKFSLENKRYEDAKLESETLRTELTSCKRKIDDFENFLKGRRKNNNSINSNSTVGSPSIEALRAGVTSNYNSFHRFSPLLKRLVEERSARDEREDHDEDEDEDEESPEDGLVDVDENQVPEDEIPGEESSEQTPDDEDKTSSKYDINLDTVIEIEKSVSSASKTQPSSSSLNSKVSLPKTQSSAVSRQPSLIKSSLSTATSLPSTVVVSPSTAIKRTSLVESPSTADKPTSDESKEEVISTEERISEELFPDNNSQENVSSERRKSSKGDDSPFDSKTPGRHSSVESGFDETESRKMSSDPLINPNSLEEIPEEIPEDHPEGGDENPPDEVLVYEVTTVSDFKVEDETVEYIGSKIIPSDSMNPVPDNEAQESRLEGTDSMIELAKLRTQLDQLYKALEAEKEKSRALEEHLHNIANMPNGDSPSPGHCCDGEQQICQLEQMLEEKNRNECMLLQKLKCATKAYNFLIEENAKLRAIIDEMREELDESSDDED